MSQKPLIAPLIAIDARMIGPVPHGIARYVTDILHELRKRSSSLYEILVLISQQMIGNPIWKNFEVEPLRSPFLSPTEWVEVPNILKKRNAALYYSPSFSSLPFCPCPHLVTLHDLNHLRFGNLPQKLYYQTLVSRFARTARTLSTVSKFSQNQISEWLRISPSEIELIPNAIYFENETGSSASLLEPLGLQPGQYFLAMLNRKTHKNAATLIAAYQRWRQSTRTSPFPLVLTCEGLTAVPGVIQTGGVSDLVARALLEHAHSLFAPSLYEGFGRVPVEAALLGKKLVVADIPAHREALDDLKQEECHWCDPTQIQDWTDAFQLASENKLRSLSQESQAKLRKRFSLEELGQKTERMFLKALEV